MKSKCAIYSEIDRQSSVNREEGDLPQENLCPSEAMKVNKHKTTDDILYKSFTKAAIDSGSFFSPLTTAIYKDRDINAATANLLLTYIETHKYPIFAIDINGRVLAWNTAIEKLTGLKKEQILGKDNYAYAIPFYGRRRPMLIDMVINKNRHYLQSYTVLKNEENIITAKKRGPVTKTGLNYCWCKAAPVYDNQGSLIGALEVMLYEKYEDDDIHSILTFSHDALYRAFKSGPNLMTITTLHDRRYIKVNDKFCSVTGYSYAEVIGRTAVELGLMADPADQSRINRWVNKEGHIHNLQYTFNNRYGEKRIGLLSAEPFEMEGQKYLINTTVDITEKLEAEKKLGYSLCDHQG